MKCYQNVWKVVVYYENNPITDYYLAFIFVIQIFLKLIFIHIYSASSFSSNNHILSFEYQFFLVTVLPEEKPSLQSLITVKF